MKQGLLDESNDSGDEDKPKKVVEVKKAAVPTPMPAAGHTLEFPRRDNMYKKKEYVLTVACLEKCNQIKSDLFNLVKSINF